MKHKAFKLIFAVSFLPALILLGISLYHAIAGYDVYTMILPEYVRTIYGWEAFGETLVWNGIALCVIPVLPLMLIYQIVYVICRLVGKHKQNEDKADET